MGGLLGFSRAVDRINTVIGRGVSWLILVAILVSAANAIVRKVWSVSSNAWLELQWYLYGAAFLLAAAYTLLENEHIRIDIVYGGRKRRTQHWIDLLGHLLFLMPFVILMIWLMVPWLERSILSGERSMNAGGLILWPAKALLLAGFILLFFQGLSEIIKKIAVMRGLIPDPHAEADAYEARIAAAGGIDLQLLGIGRNGHIGFNEPTSSLCSRTRVKTLTGSTRAANARFFAEGEEPPTCAITMGLATILDARQVLLLAFGKEKAPAVRAAIEGPVSAFTPASVLQMHRRATVILDQAAASKLELREYYHTVHPDGAPALV